MPTFYDRFVECADRWPQNIALEIQRRDGIESYTYAETRRMAESIGHWLIHSGFQPGDRCAILADNHPRWIATYLGVIAAGCTAVPLDTALHADQIGKLLKDAGASLLFCDAKHCELAEQALAGLSAKLVLTETQSDGTAAEDHTPHTVQTVTDLDSIFAAGNGDFAPVPVGSDDLASLLYTSGTTADPKGVMLTHANLLAEVEAVRGWAHLGPDDAVLGVLPLFHVLSQMANLLLPLVNGARAVHLETLNTTELVRALQERNITGFAVVPQFFYLIHERIFKEVGKHGRLAKGAFGTLMGLNRRLRSLGLNAGPALFGKIHKTFGVKMRYLVTGGSRFDPQIGRDFYALGIDVLQAYGLTETTGGAFATSARENVIGSVGKPLAGVEGKIIDPQPQEERASAIGEIAIRGGIVMKGYWKRPDATADVLKDGWLHTGDLGHFDARGNLFITGRKKDVIILSNGKNVYPEEIEAHYLQSPYIKELCVLGLEARPGDPSSERLYAVIVPNFDLLRERKIVNAKEVIRFDVEGLSAQIPSTKRISSYEIWQEDLARTTTRKIRRFEVERRVRAKQASGVTTETEISARAPLSSEDSSWLAQPDVQRAIQIMRDAARNKPESIRPGDSLELDLGLDSMQRVELLVALEQELGGNVEESRLGEIYTVRELVDLVRESAARGEVRSQKQFAGWEAVLNEEPADPDVLALTKPRPVAERFWFLASRVAKIISRTGFRLRVTGLEKLPANGPFIISSNHQSYLDPVVLASVLPWRILRNSFAVGTSEIFGSGSMRKLAAWVRVVVVDPDANLVPAMRAGAYGLRHGRVLLLYPEGERSIDGTPKIFKKGAAILSIHTQAPIVPVAIDGFHEAWPRGKSFQRFSRLKIAFGEPIQPPPISQASEEAYEKLTAELKARIVKMWEEIRIR
jgi:long-chain acyl-CoA synthetase